MKMLTARKKNEKKNGSCVRGSYTWLRMGEEVEADIELSLRTMRGSLWSQVMDWFCDIELNGMRQELQGDVFLLFHFSSHSV